MGDGLGAIDEAAAWTATGSIRRCGHDLHYAEIGEGPPLVLLHKLGGWVREWAPLANRLSGARRVIAFDLPGHGHSRAPGPPPHVQTLEETASALVGALDVLDIPTFDLAGASLGGAVAVVVAALWPERVGRLDLLGAPLSPGRTRQDVAEQDVRTAAALWGRGDVPLPRPFAEVARQFGLHDRAIHTDMLYSRMQAGAWVRPSWRGVALGDVAGRLALVRAPISVVVGDRTAAKAEAGRAAEALRHSRFRIVPQSGAFPHQENPAAVAKLLLD